MSRLLLTLALLLPGVAVAQEAPGADPVEEAPPKDTGGGGLRFGLGDGEEEVIDPELLAMDVQTLETEARAKLYESQLLTARRYAEELLRRDPDNIVGHFIVGNAYRESDGNLAKAMFHLGRARELYETAHGTWGVEGDNLHADILRSTVYVALELEEHQYALDLIDYHDSRYQPQLRAERAWPLMKLGRYDEAREAATAGRDALDPWQASVGWNALCAIETMAGDRAASLTACEGALEHERKMKEPDLTTDAYNAALAALSNLKFTDAERLGWEANTGQTLSNTNPHTFLAFLFLAMGRGVDAVDSVSRMQSWQAAQPPYLRDKGRAASDATLAMVLWVAGRSEDALAAIDRAILFPDRLGSSSGQEEQVKASHALLRLAIARTHAERDAEAASARGLLPLLWSRLSSWMPSLQRWSDRAAVRALLADRDALLDSLRPYLFAHGVDLAPWMTGELVSVLGPAVVRAAADLAAYQEPDETFSGYRAAMEVEILYAEGDDAEVLVAMDEALAALPKEEVLLRARVTARGGQAAWRDGDAPRALELYAQAYALDPGVIRRLGIALPGKVIAPPDGGDGEEAGEMFARSPRITAHDGGFSLVVTEDTTGLTACLMSPADARLRCVHGPEEDALRAALYPEEEAERLAKAEAGEVIPPRELTEHDRAMGLVLTFYEQAFSMPLGVSNLDKRSLDGVTAVAKEAERKRLESLLNRLEKPKKKGGR